MPTFFPNLTRRFDYFPYIYIGKTDSVPDSQVFQRFPFFEEDFLRDGVSLAGL